MSTSTDCAPHCAAGIVVKGFGRGSKDLGIPTANFASDVVESLPPGTKNGIYYGVARVMDGPVYKMVMSVGWNPYYNNTKKSMETHILHEFDNDFYGEYLRIIMLGFIRPEENYDSLEKLIAAIQNDIRVADEKLATTDFKMYFEHEFLTIPTAESMKQENVKPSRTESSSEQEEEETKKKVMNGCSTLD